MPWHVARSASCPENRPWAVIKDADGEVEGCHMSHDDAMQHMAALYANEPKIRYAGWNTAKENDDRS